MQALVLPCQVRVKLPQGPAVGAHEGSGHTREAAGQLLCKLLMHAGLMELVGMVIVEAIDGHGNQVWLAVNALVGRADLGTGA